MSNWFDRIEINPEDDKAYIKGTSIRVGEIIDLVESGQSVDQIVERNPLLDREAVKAAIFFRNRFNYAHC